MVPQSYVRYHATNVHSQHGFQDTPIQLLTAADPI